MIATYVFLFEGIPYTILYALIGIFMVLHAAREEIPSWVTIGMMAVGLVFHGYLHSISIYILAALAGGLVPWTFWQVFRRNLYARDDHLLFASLGACSGLPLFLGIVIFSMNCRLVLQFFRGDRDGFRQTGIAYVTLLVSFPLFHRALEQILG